MSWEQEGREDKREGNHYFQKLRGDSTAYSKEFMNKNHIHVFNNIHNTPIPG